MATTIKSIDGELYANGVRLIPETEVLGVGQTWQDMTLQRVEDEEYINDTGKPIQIYVSINNNTKTYGKISVTINGLILDSKYSSGDDNSNYGPSMSIIVPSGASYSIGAIPAEAGIYKWYELR